MQPYFARFGISGAQFGVLRTLERAEKTGGGRLGVTELSERLLIRPPSVTGVVDRLVRDGLVTRAALPADRRVKQIELTEKGRQRIAAILAVHGGQVQKILSGLSPSDQGEFNRLLVRLGEHLESLAKSQPSVDNDANEK